VLSMKNPKPLSKISSQGGEQGPVRLRLSSIAETELEAIDAYSFEQYGDEVAATYMRAFDELFDLLRYHPFAGQDACELGKGIRTLAHRSHRIFYHIGQDEILITRILHHAMDAKRVLKGTAR
jgi:toxin ParE1/3/4